MIYPISSDADQTTALGHMLGYLQGSALLDCLSPNVIRRECLRLDVAAAPGLPAKQDYRFGWGGASGIAFEWLVSELRVHLCESGLNVGVVEDPSRAERSGLPG